MAVQLRRHEQPGGEDAVGVVVGDDVVAGSDARLAEQLGEGVRTRKHPGLGRTVFVRAEAVEGNVDRTRNVADPLVLPGVPDVHDGDPRRIQAIRDPHGVDDSVVHGPTFGPAGLTSFLPSIPANSRRKEQQYLLSLTRRGSPGPVHTGASDTRFPVLGCFRRLYRIPVGQRGCRDR